jgi:hydroxypyruvate reductase
MKKTKARADLEHIFRDALHSVDPKRLIGECMRLEGERLFITTPGESFSIDLQDYEKIVVLGAGKATAAMAKAVEEILVGLITDGIISVKYGHTEQLGSIETIEAGHPVPDANGVKAAERITQIARDADRRTLILYLISGGGSALLSSPVTCTVKSQTISLSLNDLQETTKVLLASGATIGEVNCIRKHLSSIKGGKLAVLGYPALQVSLILSDVIGDRLDSIASGLTVYDHTTYVDAMDILRKYGIMEQVPKNVLSILEAGSLGLVPETPKAGNEIFQKVSNVIIGNNYSALQAARKKALNLGYNTLVLSSQVIGEAKEVAKVFAGIALDVRRAGIPVQPPACVIWGGETTVTLLGSGRGGRNQEFALSFLIELKERYGHENSNIHMLAASTDGNDGPTDAAGAYVLPEVLKKSGEMSLDAPEYLQNNDSNCFFERVDALFRTGPTNTNVCDIQVVIVV